MAINSLDSLVAALGPSKRVRWTKTVPRAAGSGGSPTRWYHHFDLPGYPGAGPTSPSNTTTGIVPVAGDAGYPRIASFGGLPGYVARAQARSNVACRVLVCDRLFHAGSFAHNDDVTLSGQPSFDARVPDADFSQVEMWVETTATSTGIPHVELGYRNQDDVDTLTGIQSNATIITAYPGVCWRIQLAPGDKGVKRLNSVRFANATAGTFNVMLVRTLVHLRVSALADSDLLDAVDTALPRVYDSSALFVMTNWDTANTTALGEIDLDIVTG